MRELTLSLDEGLYLRLERLAEERNMEVSEYVVDYIKKYTEDLATDGEQEWKEKLVEEIQAIAKKYPGFSAADRLPREELYQRRREE